ncbi:hypothetical protein ACFQZZ_29700 [Nocardia sp. GCM10030253]|uniref:hypothetical protein n=1 Tax=Nocardia sp. GCM10030253 TaxID=3273404 RepID=UPI00363FCCA3
MTGTAPDDEYFYPTGRESCAIYALVQHRAMQPDVLADFLGTGRNHVYEMVAKLRDSGMVHPLTKVSSGPKWIVPTRKAVAQVFGHRMPDWAPSRLWSARGRAIAQVRIALGATGYYDWESERELRYTNGFRGTFPYDGRLTLGGALVAVKVDGGSDAAPSKLAETLARTIRAAADPGDGLLYVCAGTTEPATVRTTVDALTRHGIIDTSATRVAAVDFDDLTDPAIPVLTPWGVA